METVEALVGLSGRTALEPYSTVRSSTEVPPLLKNVTVKVSVVQTAVISMFELTVMVESTAFSSPPTDQHLNSL